MWWTEFHFKNGIFPKIVFLTILDGTVMVKPYSLLPSRIVQVLITKIEKKLGLGQHRLQI